MYKIRNNDEERFSFYGKKRLNNNEEISFTVSGKNNDNPNMEIIENALMGIEEGKVFVHQNIAGFVNDIRLLCRNIDDFYLNILYSENATKGSEKFCTANIFIKNNEVDSFAIVANEEGKERRETKFDSKSGKITSDKHKIWNSFEDLNQTYVEIIESYAKSKTTTLLKGMRDIINWSAEKALNGETNRARLTQMMTKIYREKYSKDPDYSDPDTILFLNDLLKQILLEQGVLITATVLNDTFVYVPNGEFTRRGKEQQFHFNMLNGIQTYGLVTEDIDKDIKLGMMTPVRHKGNVSIDTIIKNTELIKKPIETK